VREKGWREGEREAQSEREEGEERERERDGESRMLLQKVVEKEGVSERENIQMSTTTSRTPLRSSCILCLAWQAWLRW